MATYIVTTSNWNSVAFWNAITETGPGHTLDFSALPPSFVVDHYPTSGSIRIENGTTSFVIADSTRASTFNAQMGGTTELGFFTTIIGSRGDDLIDGYANDDTIEGRDGNDFIWGHDGDDQIEGDAGNDELYGDAGDDSLFGSGGTGSNNLEGGRGQDLIDGSGGGYDVASYSGSSSAVDIDLSDSSAESSADAQGDTLIGIE